MTSESDSIRENKPAPNAEGESTKKTSHPEIPIPLTPTPKSECQPTKSHCEITCKTEKNWWDKTKPFVEMGGAILLTIYTFYTVRMYCVNKIAADAAASAARTAATTLGMYKQQIEGVEAAIVNERLWFENGKIYFDVRDFGRVISNRVIISLGIFRQKYSDKINVLPIGHLDKELFQMEPIPEQSRTDPWVGAGGHQMIVMAILSKDSAVIDQANPRYTFIIKGTLTYDNGFGHTITKPICKAYGYQPLFVRPSGQGVGGTQAMIECSDYRAWIDTFTEDMRREHATPQK